MLAANNRKNRHQHALTRPGGRRQTLAKQPSSRHIPHFFAYTHLPKHMKPVELNNVPETMLWTLHNRASEARRNDGLIRDPKCLEIYEAIQYGYQKSFGKAEASHAIRSFIFDRQLRRFVEAHPDGVIINLGEGLETQRFRINTGPETTWLCVDVPEAVRIREHFISPDEQHLHLAQSAFDHSWFDAVPQNRPVFLTAQGLFMYFQPSAVKQLLQAMAERWPGMWLMFDHIPPWLSRKTTSARGWQVTRNYRTPPMPWGIRSSQVHSFLLECCPEKVFRYENLSREFIYPRGLSRAAMKVLMSNSWTADLGPGISKAQLGESR